MKRQILCAALLLVWIAVSAFAADLNVPQRATAGQPLTIGTTGSGDGTLYLVGPGARSKQKIRIGESVTIKPEDLRRAGEYTAILRGDGGATTKRFFVSPAATSDINFLAQPSRVPTGAHDVISGTAFVMDRYRNLVLTPTPVKFELAVEGGAPVSRTVTSKDGVAWTRIDSTKRAGNAQFTASVSDVEVKRVVQQTAAEPCNLRMRAQPSKNGILVETDPIRDCSGNPVPDGTIVTFTAIDPKGKSTVDARIKRGIARAELPPAQQAGISVASGVVVGNEIRWGGGR